MAPYNYTADINWSFALGLMASVCVILTMSTQKHSTLTDSAHFSSQLLMSSKKTDDNRHQEAVQYTGKQLEPLQHQGYVCSNVQCSYLDCLFHQCWLEPGCVSHLPFSPVPQCWDSKSDTQILALFQQQKLVTFFFYFHVVNWSVAHIF